MSEIDDMRERAHQYHVLARVLRNADESEYIFLDAKVKEDRDAAIAKFEDLSRDWYRAADKAITASENPADFVDPAGKCPWPKS